MTRKSYTWRASKRFLEGTRCKSPIEAVEKGVKNLEDWVAMLAEERELERPFSRDAIAGRKFAQIDADE
jgi:hypothetical protein